MGKWLTDASFIVGPCGLNEKEIFAEREKLAPDAEFSCPDVDEGWVPVPALR